MVGTIYYISYWSLYCIWSSNCKYNKFIMKQEDKNLLIQDLCARLPYGVKINISYDKIDEPMELIFINPRNESFTIGGSFTLISGLDFDIYECKPYLFPLSNMTEEQYNSLHELGILNNCSHSYEYVNPHIHGVSFIFKEFKTYSLELIEWLNKNHFDYRGLISMGLAIDATGLNIY